MFRFRRQYVGPVRGVIFDWAGTMIDHGCCGPVGVFTRAFAENGVEVTEAEVRGPMGMGKREHFLTMVAMPSVAARWRAKHGRDPNEADVDAMYDRFLPLLVSTVTEYADFIPGALDTYRYLRSRGIRVGSTTGYPREPMGKLVPLARAGGYEPETVLTSSDVKEGRPAPFLIFECMRIMGLYPSSSIVVVDDSVPGVAAGLNAGAWAVGVAASGTQVGLTAKAYQALPDAERKKRTARAAEELAAGGAHYVIDSVAELPAVIEAIERHPPPSL